MLFNLKELIPKVYSVLKHYPQARDDDRLLLIQVWSKESNADKVSDFFNELREGRISLPDTLTRIRRKLQEEHEELRGEKWQSRHSQQKQVCQQLNLIR